MTKVAPEAISLIFLTFTLYWNEMVSTVASRVVLIISIANIVKKASTKTAHSIKLIFNKIPPTITAGTTKR